MGDGSLIPTTPSVGPDEALARLKAGNKRFAKSKVSTGKPVAARRAQTAKNSIHLPSLLGCADSRSAPEIIFDQNIGDLFVIRTAGNLVDDHALGSIEYAVDHLGTRLIVVLGHARCGAVTAALAGGSLPATSIHWCAIFNPRWLRQRKRGRCANERYS